MPAIIILQHFFIINKICFCSYFKNYLKLDSQLYNELLQESVALGIQGKSLSILKRFQKMQKGT